MIIYDDRVDAFLYKVTVEFMGFMTEEHVDWTGTGSEFKTSPERELAIDECVEELCRRVERLHKAMDVHYLWEHDEKSCLECLGRVPNE